MVRLTSVSPCSADHRDLHSFPTRRSSDLPTASVPPTIRPTSVIPTASRAGVSRRTASRSDTMPSTTSTTAAAADRRSEEHTSELQSQSNLVCGLLLEKTSRAAHEQNDQQV